MKQKKVLISTLTPLGGNYGGALQAFALQYVLRKMGHDVTTDNSTRPVRTLRTRAGDVKRFLMMTLLKSAPSHIDVSTVPEFAVYTSSFIKREIQTVDLRSGRSRPRSKDVAGYDAFVVGSDQVWRASYTDVAFQLFDYVPEGVTKLSYAASFGIDTQAEYSRLLIDTTRQLAKKLSGVSVREDSGIRLAKELWGVEAEHHIDPTLLLNASDYKDLIVKSPLQMASTEGELFVYVLDMSEESKHIVNKAANSLGMKVFELLPEKFLSKSALRRQPERYALPPIEQWLKSFIDAKFVITDSFHGTVFSIIFQKPFIAIGNKSRGLARFLSLLKMFDLEDRLVLDVEDVTDVLLNGTIDWNAVEKRRESERQRSYEYLKKHL